MEKIYFLADSENNIKIGYTKQSINKRIQQLQTGNGNKIICLGWMEGDKKLEKELHLIFNNFKTSSKGEWFYPEQSIVDFINYNNYEKNTYVDFVDGKLMPLLKI